MKPTKQSRHVLTERVRKALVTLADEIDKKTLAGSKFMITFVVPN